MSSFDLKELIGLVFILLARLESLVVNSILVVRLSGQTVTTMLNYGACRCENSPRYHILTLENIYCYWRTDAAKSYFLYKLCVGGAHGTQRARYHRLGTVRICQGTATEQRQTQLSGPWRGYSLHATAPAGLHVQSYANPNPYPGQKPVTL